jgi:hypothetical protein
MAETRSQSRKSQPGESGPEEMQARETPPLEKSHPLNKVPDFKSEPEAAPPAKDLDKPAFKSGVIFLTEKDRKLALSMTRQIYSRLGLNSKARSYRVN